MTTPGGVPNLPHGALTLDTLASKTQDMSQPAMKSRAVERFSSIFNNSTGLDPALDITPFGILTGLWSGFNSQVANADPANVQGPEDLPGLLLQFIEGLPVIGQFVDLLDAILGTYTGTDATLLTVQAIFAPIRAIVDALTAVAGGTGGLGNFFPDLLGLLGNPTGLGSGTVGLGSLSSIPILGPVLGLFGGATSATQASNFITNLLSLFNSPTGLTGAPGTFDPAAALTNWVQDLLGPLGLLLTGDSPLSALNLFGLLPTNLFGLLPTSSLGGASPNLLVNPVFDTAASLLGETVWSFDGTQTHTGTGGSATVTANGVNKDLLSNGIPVVSGQQLPMSIWTKWSGLTSTGSPISLGVTGFLNGVEVASSTLASVASPGAAGGWSQLTGTYTTPAGVDEVRMRLHVGTTATAGSVWFDDGSITKNVATNVLPQSAITGLVQSFLDIFGIFGGATSQGQAGNVFTNLLSMLNNPTGLTGSPGSFNPSTALSSLITGLINPLGLLAPLSGGTVPTSNIPSLPDSLIPGLGSWIDTIFNGLTGLGQSGVTQSDAGAQVSQLTDTVASVQAAVADLISRNDQSTFFGLRGRDDLERVAPIDLGGSSFWNQTNIGGTSGTWAIADGHTAKWIPGSGVRTVKAIRTDAADKVTQTDFQKVGLTIGSQVISSGFFSSGNVENSILLRASADGSSYVRARITNNQAQFFYRNGGSETPLGSAVSTSHGAGVNFYGIAGTAGNIRTFQLVRNNSPILTVTDNTTVTALGASNRNWGHTVTGDGGDVPSSVTQFTVADNTPAAVVGTTMRVFRGTTTGITKSAGASAMPANTFDTVDYISADMVWNAATSTLTVTKAGTYLFSGRFEMANPIGFSEEIYPTVYTNGTLRVRGGARRGITAAAFGVPHFPQDLSAGGDAMLLYCPAGATLQLGFFATASNTVIGDAAGHKTWFAAVKIG